MFLDFRMFLKYGQNKSEEFNGAFEDHEEPLSNTHQRSFTVLFKDSAQSRRNVGHMTKNHSQIWHLYPSDVVCY